MPPVRHAHLLLPSALGLLEYDVLEEAVFLGTGPKGVTAAASPFKGAVVALTRGQGGFVVRPLPGEDAPEVNGEATAEKTLEDGDRVKIGDQVILFRSDRGPVRAPPPTKPRSSPPSRRAAAERPPKASSAANTLVTLIGAVLVLIGAVRAVSHLGSMQDEKRAAETEMPETPQVRVEEPSRAARDLAAIRAYEQDHPTHFNRIAERYRAFVEHHVGKPEVDVAQSRLREIMEDRATRERGSLSVTIDKLLGARQFAKAAQLIRAFEEDFGSTQAGHGVGELRERVDAEARATIDETKENAAVLIEKNPRQALRMLRSVAATLPPELTPEVADLMDAARAAVDAESGRDPAPLGPRRLPPAGDPDRPAPPPDSGPGHVGDSPEAHAEQIAGQAWRAAFADLTSARFKEAVAGYTLLTARYGTTKLVRENATPIREGLRAAEAGAHGPAAILNVEAETRGDRISVEYTFSRPEELEDFTREQPLAGDRSLDIKTERGSISIAGTSGLLHQLVFLPDVRIEVNGTADIAHDFGLIAVEESDQYRALIFSINNTVFKLKKGDDARPNPGHQIWYIGQGVWAAADDDQHGFIKIAERTVSKLKDGDKIKMEMERRKDACECSFGAASDGVHLKGDVYGDDKSTMGPARVGVFANTGVVRVHQVRISGVVDPDWWAEHVKWLVTTVRGPE